MSKRSDALLLEDISEAISRILKYTDGYNLPMFENDDRTIDARDSNPCSEEQKKGNISSRSKFENQVSNTFAQSNSSKRDRLLRKSFLTSNN